MADSKGIELISPYCKILASTYNLVMKISILLVSGEKIEKVTDSNICNIGRSSKCELVIPHEGVSRQHCQIEEVNGEFFVTDLGSTNGVLIDGVKIEPHKKTPYQTFLNLSFGPIQSIQIESLAVSDRPLRAASSLPSDSGKTSMTRTKSMMPQKAKPTSAPASAKPDDKGSEKQKILLLIVIVVIGLAWYLHSQEMI